MSSIYRDNSHLAIGSNLHHRLMACFMFWILLVCFLFWLLLFFNLNKKNALRLLKANTR